MIKLIEKIVSKRNKNQFTIDRKVQFVTNTSTFAVFDPYLLEHRIMDSELWWRNEFSEIKEFNSQIISLLRLPSDGTYFIRFTSGTLTQNEEICSRTKSEPLPFRVDSGILYIGAGESLPAFGEFKTPEEIREEFQGQAIELLPGKYNMVAHFMKQEGQSSSKMPDLVIVISQRERT